MGSFAILPLKKFISEITFKEARDIAGQVLECANAARSEEILTKYLHPRYPEFFPKDLSGL